MTKAAHFKTGYIDTRTHCRLVHSFEAGGPLASALSSTFYIFSRNFFPPQTNITRVIFDAKHRVREDAAYEAHEATYCGRNQI